ncbi:MAG: hypothetical protein EZS28_009459 [Streblomastix strix]|uniref:Uncharacterized protein n=1 Tax=Streblomastix strix TaxID=222440 RepID=A0A5J4WJR6_9EUKA|nr:MAG: hypothetical protein EZS28_009459 [Streblomastix strix]
MAAKSAMRIFPNPSWIRNSNHSSHKDDVEVQGQKEYHPIDEAWDLILMIVIVHLLFPWSKLSVMVSHPPWRSDCRFISLSNLMRLFVMTRQADFSLFENDWAPFQSYVFTIKGDFSIWMVWHKIRAQQLGFSYQMNQSANQF